MTRVPFGATCSPFLLTATILHHLKNTVREKAETAKLLSESFYVDDLVTGAATEQEAIKVCIEAQEIMEAAGMTLRKWTTNSDQVMEFLKQEQRVASKEMVVLQESTVKVLGITWDPAKDTFSFVLTNLMDFLKSRANSKRSVLQTASRVFDPLGFVGPFTIAARILFQKLWSRGIAWDEHLPQGLRCEWDEWVQLLLKINIVTVPRCVGGTFALPAELETCFLRCKPVSIRSCCLHRRKSPKTRTFADIKITFGSDQESNPPSTRAFSSIGWSKTSYIRGRSSCEIQNRLHALDRLYYRLDLDNEWVGQVEAIRSEQG